jgi:hypothetical protein
MLMATNGPAHEPGEHAVDLLHRRRPADQRQLVIGVVSIGRWHGRTMRHGQRALDDIDELAQVKGLREILERAALGRFYRGQQRVLRAHHDDTQLGSEFLDPRHQIEAILVGHHDVGDDEIALPVRHPAPERRGVAGRAHVVAEAA